MRWVTMGGTEVAELPTQAISDITLMMEKYSDLPMDLADVSLIWLAGKIGIYDIITLDVTDFDIYRLPNGKRLNNLLMR